MVVGEGDLITVAGPWPASVLGLQGLEWEKLAGGPFTSQGPHAGPEASQPEVFLSTIPPRATASSGTALSCSSPTTSTSTPSSTSSGCWWGGCPPCVW